MRQFCFLIACLFGAPLLAETVGNIKFQFPPSINEWVLLTDINVPSDDNQETCNVKIYTHRAGDALEFFTTAIVNGSDDDDEEEEMQTADFVQTFINEQLMGYFPNHRVVINQFESTKETAFLEWELNDGIQQLMYGLCRYFQMDDKGIILSYMTTAPKTLENSLLWTDTLNQIEVMNDY